MDQSETSSPVRWWKLSPEEQRWWRGMGETGISRQSCFFIAAAVAAELATLGVSEVLLGDLLWGSGRLTTAAAILGLGWMVRRGDRRAALALIALIPTMVVCSHWAAYWQGQPYYLEHLGLWAGTALLASLVWTWIFFLAYRTEKRAMGRSVGTSQAGG